jgi:glucuronoarabinoxylan endo-1,4-beta-xylanase
VVLSGLAAIFGASRPQLAHAAGSFMQANAASASGSGSVLTVPFLAGVSPGDVILVGIDFDANSTVSSVTDSQNNAFQQLGTELVSPGGTHSVVYFAGNVQGGDDQVTVTLTADSAFIDEYVVEYAGVDVINPVDAVAGASGPAGTVTSGGSMTTSAGDIIYGFCIGDSTCAPGPGFVGRLALNNNLVEEGTAGDAGLYEATAFANDGWTMTMVALRPGPSGDTVPPSTPLDLSAIAVSSTQINLAWTASTDNIGVAGYQIYRNGSPVATSLANSYSDQGLAASTSYSYTVAAYDGAANISAQSQSASATTPDPADVIVNFADVHQRIDGFGASDAFLGTLTDAQADLFFSSSAGIGLSILRVGIDQNGNKMGGPYSNATKAAARGAIVWGAPWTAPGAWKDNGSTSNGGHLLPEFYDAWATRLATFAANFQQNAGVPLWGLSVQNEPDYDAAYMSMLYTSQEMTDFINVLGPKLAALNPQPRLIAPEGASWSNAWDFTSAILGDSAAPPFLNIIAAHQYAGVSAPGTADRPIWQTEMSSLDAFDPSIDNALIVAQEIHDAIVTGNAGAWHYWWLIGKNPDNEGLIGYNRNTQLTKRLYALGNFSKFVRPGFVRVGTGGGPDGMSVSAYQDPATNAFVVVAVNNSGSAVSLGVDVPGSSAATVTPWVTSSSEDLLQYAPIGVSGGRFTMTVAPSTITTFVSGGSIP